MTPEQSNFPLNEQMKNEYNILRLIGVGGMGDVFLAEQLQVGKRPVALKILNSTCSEDPEMVQRFQNEAASAGRINHQNVVTIYESRITTDGQLYVAMEYVEGKTLTLLLHEEGALPLARVVKLTKQLCAGLASAHRLGIVHRDIKPDNVMITEDEGAEVVKILDFGLARISEAISATKRTQAGIIMGTPEYMSPEQAMGRTGDNIDARSDVYSVAMVVYEMLTGRPAFQAENPFETIKKHMTEMPKPLRYWKPDLQIPDEVERVLLKALEKERDKRQQSIADFIREFAAAASQREQRDSAKTALFGGAAPETVAVSSQENQATSPADANKTSLLGAKITPAAPLAEEANKTTLLGAKSKQPSADVNKTTMLGAHTAQQGGASPESDADNKTTLLGAHGRTSRPADRQNAPPAVSHHNETIDVSGKLSAPLLPPPSSYETVADVASYINASETQAYFPSHDPPASFSNRLDQPPPRPAEAQSPMAGMFIKPDAVASQPVSEAKAREPEAPPAVASYAPTPVYQSAATAANPRKKWLLIGAIAITLIVVGVIVWLLLPSSSRDDATKTSPAAASASVVEYRIKRETPTTELETLNVENLVKADEGFGFEIKLTSPGAVYLFGEQSDKNDGSWRWLNAPRAGEAPATRVGEWTPVPFGYWLRMLPGLAEEKFMIVYVPRNLDWSPAMIGVSNLTIKNGVAEVSREAVANLKAYLQREATPLNSTNDVRDKNVRFSLSKEGTTNRLLFAEFSLKLTP